MAFMLNKISHLATSRLRIGDQSVGHCSSLSRDLFEFIDPVAREGLYLDCYYFQCSYWLTH